MKKYWYVLLDDVMHRYGNRSDTMPRETKELKGVFIRDYAEPKIFEGAPYYCFYLMFPEKRSIFSFTEASEKDRWVSAIKNAVG